MNQFKGKKKYKNQIMYQKQKKSIKKRNKEHKNDKIMQIINSCYNYYNRQSQIIYNMFIKIKTQIQQNVFRKIFLHFQQTSVISLYFFQIFLYYNQMNKNQNKIKNNKKLINLSNSNISPFQQDQQTYFTLSTLHPRNGLSKMFQNLEYYTRQGKKILREKGMSSCDITKTDQSSNQMNQSQSKNKRNIYVQPRIRSARSNFGYMNTQYYKQLQKINQNAISVFSLQFFKNESPVKIEFNISKNRKFKYKKQKKNSLKKVIFPSKSVQIPKKAAIQSTKVKKSFGIRNQKQIIQNIIYKRLSRQSIYKTDLKQRQLRNHIFHLF